MKYFILLVALSIFPLTAKTFTYEQVHQMPKSVEKDYYIWRFLSQPSTTSQQAQAIIRETDHLNKKLRKAYKKRTGKRPPKIGYTKDVTPDYIWKNRSKARKYFKKGLNLMRQGKPELATSYFETARRHYIKQHQIDKTLFWLYLSSKNKVYLQYLQKSTNPNIYSLLAIDTIQGKYPKTITEQFRKKSTKGFDIKNPIHWAYIKAQMKHSTAAEISDFAESYSSQECLGIYTYLKAKSCNHTKSYFPMPYRNAMKHMSPQRQALIYAIARQESRFVPASVSRSFALGMMQFMPFLVQDIAKKKGYNMDLDEMFNPYRAIEFADFHLDFLTKSLHHPLFVAYAYNAGIGFTRKILRNPRNFKNGPYEPYMTLESMKNVEAREYGKKVLANYVIYLNKLGVPTRISPLIQTIATPSKK